jgi:tetratricopeptide (TPR) repeat protein
VVIARSLQRLSSLLKVERPLAQLRILAEEPGVLSVELAEGRMDLSGQLLLDFGARRRRAGRIAPLPARRRRLSSEEWLEIGAICEEEGLQQDAAQAYRRAVGLLPCHAQAHLRLGKVLRDLGDLPGAEAAFRAALQHDRACAAAWHGLAELHHADGRLTEAITALERALEASPDDAAAHLSMALACEQAGRSAQAGAHWRAYLQLAPEGEWAPIARQRIPSGCESGVP